MSQVLASAQLDQLQTKVHTIHPAVLRCESPKSRVWSGGMPFAKGFVTRMESAAVIGRSGQLRVPGMTPALSSVPNFGLVGGFEIDNTRRSH